MAKINYGKILDDKLTELKNSGIKPTLLLHACCAPCSSYVLEYLSKFFDITLYFYNPNITPVGEYTYRAEELLRLVGEMGLGDHVNVAVAKYNSDEFSKLFFNNNHYFKKLPIYENGAKLTLQSAWVTRKDVMSRREVEYFLAQL